jgi:hypothetical protein
MKRFPLAVLLIATTLAMTAGLRADDLVETAKAAKARRKKSTTKVITNADVKKAKSTLVVTQPADVAIEPVPTESSLQKQARERKEQTAADLKLAAATKTVADFEKELAAVEQKYYEENDLNRRDGELVRHFNLVKAKLEAARKDLAALMPEPEPVQ